MTAVADYRRRAQLSWRIRAYVAVLAMRMIGFALALWADADLLAHSRIFRHLFEVLSPTGWAVLHGALGLAALGGLIRPRERGVRTLVILSVGLSSAWATGAVLAMSTSASALVVIAFVTFAFKDLIVAGMVYVNPLEELVRGDAARRRSAQ